MLPWFGLKLLGLSYYFLEVCCLHDLPKLKHQTLYLHLSGSYLLAPMLLQTDFVHWMRVGLLG